MVTSPLVVFTASAGGAATSDGAGNVGAVGAGEAFAVLACPAAAGAVAEVVTGVACGASSDSGFPLQEVTRGEDERSKRATAETVGARMRGILPEGGRATQQGRVGWPSVKPRPSSLALLGICALSGGHLVACKEKGAGQGPAGSLASASVPPKTISLGPPMVQIGMRFRETRKSTLSLSVEFWQDDEKLGASELSRNEEYARAVEVLGVVGRAASKVRVHYERYRQSEARLGQPERKDAHLEGQTYLLDAAEGEMTGSTPDGKPVLGEENDTLAKLHAGLGAEDPILTELMKHPLKRGEALRMTQDQVQNLSRTAGEAKSGTITFTGTREVGGQLVAELDWSAETHTTEEGGVELDWHLKGQITVAIEPSRILSSSMTGTIDASGDKREGNKKIKMAGAGTVEDRYGWSRDQ